VTSGPAATELLRDGLLEGVRVLIVGAPPEEAAPAGPADAVRGACEALGASVAVCTLEARACADEAEMDALVQRALAGLVEPELLVVDGAGLFAAGATRAAGDGAAALRDCLQGSWNATRAVVNRALLPAARGGRIVLIAPASAAGVHAPAARAGLENLARTLSVEWARHGLTAVAVGAGEETPAEALAALVAYVASPAGDYLSGCLLAPR
jgi:NAD(P)-dependent dehydrogenase (short-subunit alcohol dehydrogenase family)